MPIGVWLSSGEIEAFSWVEGGRKGKLYKKLYDTTSQLRTTEGLELTVASLCVSQSRMAG